ncbi:Piso0_000572 [Millerozyma farinosa CBS 7064]|uniref:Piso0_000572 protein n=1 Tax=Pichia sorbitophila (strain ATCC MYA-4447 / BCRC 22081 / CBS 7064 / NBRC 10061 / NRRL Y-12695) TaxID=559304 RepID=G8YVT1_PICSO|nr:Piso0_000572 [Millerozyma farinosa CBS 7064]CCE73525.1 Piso0_000572 [Millerozyma farinosa CBS 7064]
MNAETEMKEKISGMRSKSPDEKEVGQVLSIRSYGRAAEDEDRVIDPVLSHSDNMLLADIGYKPELARHFSTFQVFGVAYSIMGLLPSVASVLGTALSAGPAGAIWGWVIAGVGIESIGIAISQLGSSCPTSGGLYYWSNYYAPEKYRSFISFLVGNTNSMALVGALCSVDYGFAEELLSVVVIGKDGDYDVTPAKTYGVFVACVFSHILLTCAASKDCARLQTVSSVANTSLILLFIIALPIGASPNFKDAATIFGKMENFSNWPTGWQFVLSWMPAIWTIGSFDSCVHMSEEAHNATKAVPIGIIGSISACYVLGFVVLVVTCACLQTNNINDDIIGTKFGQPMAAVIYDALGKKWAMALMVLICVCQFMMGASILTAISRQIWAFSRDNGLPFSFWIRRVNQKLSVPINAVWTGGVIAIVLGLLCLIGSTAANALFSLAIAGNYFSWATPILLSMTTGKSKFRPGPFYLGKFWSPLISWFAVAFAAFIIIMVMFPTDQNPGKSDMNYTCVITPGIWILSSLYYWIYAHKVYHGPRKTIEDESEVSYEQNLNMTAEDGLQKEKLKTTLGL